LGNASSRVYATAGRMVAPLLRLAFVTHIYIRRSVAAGEAEFPWSDLDLGLVIGEASGRDLWRLWQRYRLARLACPRMGECLIATAEDLVWMTARDPYRGSLDRRFAILLAGGRPPIPDLPVTRAAAARRLVFWFDHYLPLAVRTRNLRNQRKLVREMANALGVVDGTRAEPLRLRREAEVPGDLVALTPFAQCCAMAERAQLHLRPPAPLVRDVVHRPGLIVVPDGQTPLPAVPAGTVVATPAVLDLLLATQSPILWLSHRDALRGLGFAAPPPQAWLEWCRRQASGERFRQPGFSETGPIATPRRLAMIEAIVEALETGRAPESIAPPPIQASADLRAYYLHEYDRLAARAEALRERTSRLRVGEAPGD